MRQRLTAIALLFGLVSLPVAVTTVAEQFEEYNSLSVIALLASPAIMAVALDHHKPRQKA